MCISYHYEQEYHFCQQNMYENPQPQNYIHILVIQEFRDLSTRLLLIHRLIEPEHLQHAVHEL